MKNVNNLKKTICAESALYHELPSRLRYTRVLHLLNPQGACSASFPLECMLVTLDSNFRSESRGVPLAEVRMERLVTHPVMDFRVQ